MKRIWVDSNNLRPGARPLLLTESDEVATRPTPDTMRAREILIHGPARVCFSPDNTGLARVWIETEAEVTLTGGIRAGY